MDVKILIYDITPLTALLKNKGTHTELISIGPELTRIYYLNDTINRYNITAHIDEYHRSITYLYHQLPS